MKRVDKTFLTALQGEQAKRDHAAYCIGVAHLQFKEAEERFLGVVNKSKADQKRIGAIALESLGLDPEKQELTIDLKTGEVLELVDGAWKEVL